MKKWEILNQSKIKDKGLMIKDLIKILLENRRVKTKKEIEEFLNPKLETVTTADVGIDKKQLKKAIARIKLAIKNKEQVVVFGDYDVDGISGTAILWETLNLLGAKVMPYIPHRIDEGYGLSLKGISNLKSQISNVKLIITVDNGIVANKAVDFANKQGIDIIITDHHVPSKKLPDALAIVHTTKLCGTGVAYLLAQEFKKNENHLELVALATVADLVPLKGANRTLLKFGLEALRKTRRPGLLELFKEARLAKESLGVYEIGHMIAPRLNAMGRLEYAMDSLRLICTNNQNRAADLAQLLGSTNKERQDITLQATLHAIEKVKSQKSKLKSLLFIVHESYEQGVIGLVAGKLVEEFYRPAIVISKGKKFSKASARSVRGFDMIEFIRTASEFLVDAGGHPMAAGFTVETTKLLKLQKILENKAELILNKDLLTRNLRIDCELPLSSINIDLYEALQKLSPFGMGNPEPTFVSKNVIVEDLRLVGAEGKHLKLVVSSQKSGVRLEGIAFGIGQSSKISIGDRIDIVYTIEKDDWNGNERLQLKVKDLKISISTSTV
ncbi:MAG: single-stranded-DNA-specific exonuclease RecJ [Candidatus Levybacteria bacterium]|nr:single-stranded-DNA-specific exonuclease RecJ [Candidatus Levybacteria bacterium]